MRKLICLIIIQLFSQLTITAQSLDLYVEMNDHTLKLFRGEQLNQEFFRRNASNEQELIVEQKNGVQTALPLKDINQMFFYGYYGDSRSPIQQLREVWPEWKIEGFGYDDGDDDWFPVIFFVNDTIGCIYECAPNGQILDYKAFRYTVSGSTLPITITADFYGDDTQVLVINDISDDEMSATEIRQEKQYTLRFRLFNIPEQALIFYKSPIPEDFWEHPTWYGEFQNVNCWRISPSGCEKIKSLVNYKNWHLMALEDQPVFYMMPETSVSDTIIKAGDKRWHIKYGYIMHCDDNDENTCYVIYSQPVEIMSEGTEIPAAILQNPEQYGFTKNSAYYISNAGNGSTDNIEIWKDDFGFFVVGSSSWHNTYHEWMSDQPSVFVTKVGKVYVWSDMTWTSYNTDDQQSYYQHWVTMGSPTIQTVTWNPTTDSAIQIEAASSTYASYWGFSYSGVLYVDVYTDDFDLSKFTFTPSTSWLWAVNTAIAYRKGTLSEYGEEYTHTRVRIFWDASSNTGAERTGNITLTVSDAQGQNHSATYTIKQKGTSTSSGSGSSVLGSDWVSVDGVTGYGPYDYCPTAKKYYPSTKGYNSHIPIYRNTNTGEYRLVSSGKSYSCTKGYNKINVGGETHVAYITGSTKPIICYDNTYYEFTLSY